MERVTIPRRLLRTNEAAEYLAVSANQLRTIVHAGELPFIQRDERSPMRFDVRDLDQYIERSKRRMTDAGELVSVRAAEQASGSQVLEIPSRPRRSRAKSLLDRQCNDIDSAV